jgi:outer membrane PBP1 activator LpoA protein
MVIDNEVTEDKYEIGDLLKKEYEKEIAEYKTLNSSESSQDIFSNLLLVDQSLKRKRKLSRIISKDLEHQSRARTDIDTLLLSVNTQETRGLKPALDYIFFEDMEVFLINDWQEDIQFLEIDKDLEGVISIEIPFMLPSILPDDLKLLQNKSRNFAIGYDAFEIFLLIKGARNLNKTTYKGLTGKITFRDKVIQRKSTIFQINDGNYKYFN